MKEKQIEIQISGASGSGKAHVMQVVRDALVAAYGDTVRLVDRVQRKEERTPLPPPPGETRIVLTKASKENMDAINNHQALSIHASHAKCLLHWIEFEDQLLLTVGRQYKLTFVPLSQALPEGVSGLVLNVVKEGVVRPYFARCIKQPGLAVMTNIKRTFGAFSKKRFNLRWVDYKDLDDLEFNREEIWDLMGRS